MNKIEDIVYYDFQGRALSISSDGRNRPMSSKKNWLVRRLAHEHG